MDENKNKRWTLEQMAGHLGISVRTLRRDVERRKIPFYPVGSRGMRFNPHEVEAHLRTQIEQPESNIVRFPVAKRKKTQIVSRRFAEA